MTREEVLALRLHRLGLRERGGTAEQAAAVGLPDVPPGSAAVSLAARTDAGLERLVAVFGPRGATTYVGPEDLPLFTWGLLPRTDDHVRAFVGRVDLAGLRPVEALDRVADATASALAGGAVLTKDELHQALRERLPSELLPWCPGCRSHHVSPRLWRAASQRGVLARADRQSGTARYRGIAVREDPEAPAALARRFAWAYAPATPGALAAWAGIAPGHARAMWAGVEDTGAAATAPAPGGLRLLPPGDPWLQSRDREVLVPDPELRKRVWRATGAPGVVLQDGEVAALWRARSTGRRLDVEVARTGRFDRAALETEAERVATARGATELALLRA